MKLTKLTTSLLVLAASLPAVAQMDGFSITEAEGQHIDVAYNGRNTIRVMTASDTSSKERAFETYKVYTHVLDPLDPENKRVITKGHQQKFPHHRGIFIGWSKMKIEGLGQFDTWHMSRGVRQHYQSTEQAESGPDSATLTLAIDWVCNDQLLVKEKRTLVLHRPDENGAFILDQESQITAVAGDTNLGGDPEHAGCQFRAHQAVVANKSAKYVIAGGKDVRKERDIPWAAMQFRIEDRDYHVQHMSHPALPKGNRYSAYRDYGRFGAFFTRKLAKEETATFKIRFLISPGPFPADPQDVFAAKYAEYIDD